MIESYAFGRIRINDKDYTSDVIIYPDRVEDNWWRREGHHLHFDDLLGIIPEKPDTIIIGTGRYGLMKVPPDLIDRLKDMGIDVIVQKTGSACKVYNDTCRSKKVIAALHLTC